MLVLLLLTTLSACADRVSAEEKDWEKHWQSVGRFSGIVSVRVVLADQVQDYVLDWTCADEICRVTILEPEALSGISVTATPSGGLEFAYNAVTLAVDPDRQVISPLEALYEMLADWRGGIPDSFGFSVCDGENALALDFSHARGTIEFSQRTWFAPETHIPIRTEAYQDGKLICVFTFNEFEFRR